MLKVSLLAVERGDVRVREDVPPDHPALADTGVELTEPLHVDLTVRFVGDGVLARGTLRTAVRLACRRCLVSVDRPVDTTVDLLFESLSDDDAAEVGDEVYALPARGTELDLSEAVREQLLLQVPAFVLCREACAGLCPQCGADRNQGDCGCVPPKAESPWDALKKLKLD